MSRIGRAIAAKRLLSPGRKLPVYLLVFVTNRCNAACDHCFYWRELNQKTSELTIDEYDRLASSVGPLLQVTLTGGSPELRKDLPDITNVFVERCAPANITFCMLGASTDRILEQVEAVVSRHPKQRLTVAISLDGLGEEHDKLRKLPGCFDRVVATFRGLGVLKRSFPGLRLAVGMTVHGLNYLSVETTAAWVRANLPVDLLKPILVRGDPINPETLDERCKTSYMRVIDQDRCWVSGERAQLLSPMDFLISIKEEVQRDLIAEISHTQRARAVCSGGRETGVIYPNGDVLGCELREERLGNLRDCNMDLSRVWLNDSADSFRATAGKVAACAGCYHHCFLSPPIFRSPSLWPQVVRAAFAVMRRGTPQRAHATEVPVV